MIIAALLLSASLPQARAEELSSFGQLQAMAPAELREQILRRPAMPPSAMATAATIVPTGIKDDYAPRTAFGAPIASIALDQILNRLWFSKTTFAAGNRLVHVFGIKSQNNNNRSGWYVGFYVEGDAQPTLINGSKIAHLSIFTHPHREITLNGLRFDIHIDVPLRDHGQDAIKLTIQSREKDQAKAVFTLADITAGVYAIGYPIRLGDMEYRVIFAQDFLDNQGEFGGYTQDYSIALMFRDGNDYSGFHRFEHEIPADDRVLVATPLKVQPTGDSYAASNVTLGLKITAERLDVFYPVPASVRP